MGKINRRYPDLIQFCQNLEKILDNMTNEAKAMKGTASNIESTLSGTSFATSASGNVHECAEKILKLLNGRDAEVRELERKFQAQWDELKSMEERFR